MIKVFYIFLFCSVFSIIQDCIPHHHHTDGQTHNIYLSKQETKKTSIFDHFVHLMVNNHVLNFYKISQLDSYTQKTYSFNIKKEISDDSTVDDLNCCKYLNNQLECIGLIKIHIPKCKFLRAPPIT